MKKFVFFVFIIFTLPVCAQKIKNVNGEFTYYVADNVTLEEAKRKALDGAKIKAMAEVFGILTSEDTKSGGKVINGKSEEYFFINGSSEVKGEWIETTEEPKYDIRFEDGQLVVTCRIKGKAREILTAAIDIKVKVLRNGTKDKFESSQFKSGDDLYLSFQSPVNGFLAVYLEGDDGQVFCLLPYSNQKEGFYPIEANRHYVFFDPKSVPAKEKAWVDECYITCGNSSEYNQLYIIFSPNQFTKASDLEKVALYGGSFLPRQLSYEDFHRWLARCRNHDVNMTVRKVGILIEK